MKQPVKMKKRLILFILLTLIAGFLYVPFIKASDESITNLIWLFFPLGSALGILLFGWLGLQLADKSILKMPLLKKWESGQRIFKSDFNILFKPILLGFTFAIITFGLINIFLHQRTRVQ